MSKPLAGSDTPLELMDRVTSIIYRCDDELLNNSTMAACGAVST